MTSIGHAIVGASIGVGALPVDATRRYKFFSIFVFIVLANIPDIPLPNWSHEFYDFSHSVLVNLALIVLSVVILLIVGRVRKIAGLHRLILPMTCAWLSHILLDTLYNHARGVAIFWPVSTAQLAVPIPWLSVLPMDLTQNIGQVIKIFALEILSYSPLLVLSVMRFNWKKTKFWTSSAPIPVNVITAAEESAT